SDLSAEVSSVWMTWSLGFCKVLQLDTASNENKIRVVGNFISAFLVMVFSYKISGDAIYFPAKYVIASTLQTIQHIDNEDQDSASRIYHYCGPNNTF
ncbi:hypothetical protein ACH5RR_032611, partial [Cinchona calisaya]